MKCFAKQLSANQLKLKIVIVLYMLSAKLTIFTSAWNYRVDSNIREEYKLHIGPYLTNIPIAKR